MCLKIFVGSRNLYTKIMLHSLLPAIICNHFQNHDFLTKSLRLFYFTLSWQFIKSSSNEKLPSTWVTVSWSWYIILQQQKLPAVFTLFRFKKYCPIVFYSSRSTPFLQQQKMERILTLMNFENGNYGGCVCNVEMLAENNWGWLCEKKWTHFLRLDSVYYYTFILSSISFWFIKKYPPNFCHLSLPKTYENIPSRWTKWSRPDM